MNVKRKVSIRYFDNIPVRAVWDNQTNNWWYLATDIIKVLINPSDPRKYWSVLKLRNKAINKFCKKFKFMASDNKLYFYDALNDQGINAMAMIAPLKNRKHLMDWLSGLASPLDEQSKQKAYSLWNSEILKNIEVGTVKGLQQIHAYIFGGLYDFAGKVRNKDISKGGFTFAYCQHFSTLFKDLNAMPQKTLDQIINKYIEMNLIHPFMEGNGRSTRIWLDLILKQELSKCVDWSKISKQDYFNAMKISYKDPKLIYDLIKGALTDKINEREVFMKGIDTSYYYEEV